jgi:hypothetical protein
MAATLICLIRVLLTLTPKIKRIIIPNDWARAPVAGHNPPVERRGRWL